ncbi:MAG: hypothetical protein R3A10_01480 [Caldilineaceae bacterium]
MEAHVNSLRRTNLFVVDLESGGSWWRYHHLFQELLQHEINQHFDEDVIADLHVRAGTWYADHGLMDEAFAHLLAAKDIEAAALCSNAADMP